MTGWDHATLSGALQAVDRDRARWQAAFLDIWKGVVMRFGADQAAALGAHVEGPLGRKDDGDEWNYDPWSEGVATAVQTFVGQKITGVQDATKAEVTRIVGKALEEGKGIDSVAGEIQKLYAGWDSYRAWRIARTEVVSASNFGAQHAALDGGVANTKTWLSSMDDRVRDTHAELSGVTIPIDHIFWNGCMYPGDPAGPADETIMCRCSLTYHWDDSIAGPLDLGDEAPDAGDPLEDLPLVPAPEVARLAFVQEVAGLKTEIQGPEDHAKIIAMGQRVADRIEEQIPETEKTIRDELEDVRKQLEKNAAKSDKLRASIERESHPLYPEYDEAWKNARYMASLERRLAEEITGTYTPTGREQGTFVPGSPEEAHILISGVKWTQSMVEYAGASFRATSRELDAQIRAALPDEDKVLKQLDAITNKNSKLYARESAAYEAMNTITRDTYLRVMGELGEMGKDQTPLPGTKKAGPAFRTRPDENVRADNKLPGLTPAKSAKQAVEALETAAELYPRRWVEKVKDHMGTIRVATVKRGEHADGMWIHTSGQTPERRAEVMVHELGHATEAAIPKVGEAAISYLKHRSQGEVPREMRDLRPGGNYRAGEITWEDSWWSPYVGKIYRWGGASSGPLVATEITSMAMQELASGNLEHLDRGLYHWVLGMLAGAVE